MFSRSYWLFGPFKQD